MAGLDTSAFAAALKDFYEGNLNSNINENVRAWKIHSKRTRDWEGNRVALAIKTRRSWAGGASANAVLPLARSVQVINMYVSDKQIFGRIQLEERVLRKSQGDVGAFAKASRVEIEGMEETLIRSVNRQCFGVGDGKLAQVQSVAGNVVTLIAPAAGTGTGFNGEAGARFIHPDMLLSIRVGTTGSSVRADNIRVASVDYDNNTFTTDGAVSIASVVANDSVYICIQAGTDSKDNEIMGYGGIADDGTYVGTFQTASRTTYPILKSSVIGTAGTLVNLTMDQIQRAMDLSYNNSGNAKTNFLLCHTGVRAEAAKLVQLNQRYMNIKDQGQGIKENLSDDSMETTLSYNDIPFVVDRDAPYYTIFGINTDSIKHYLIQDFKWLDQDGAVLSRVSGQAAYEAALSYYGNLGSPNPNRNFVIRGVNQSIPTGLIPS